MDWLSWLDKEGRWDNKYRADEKTLIDSLTTNKLEHKERDDGVEMGEINSDLKTGKRNNKKDTTERFTAHSPKFHRDIIQPREHKGDSVPKMDELNISIADSMKSWESWLDKKNRTINDDFPKGKPPHIDYNKTPDKTIPMTIRAFEDEKDEDPMVYDNKTASWESWLDKNNGIETGHKKENKHEWDGKFSSSNIKDEAEDDDKAIGEEESLEELTDGKLEEIEKLKSWEVFLEKNQYPQDKIPEKKDEDGDLQINYETGTKLNEDGTITDPKHRKIEDENSSNNLTELFSRGNLKGKKQGAGRKGYNNAGDSGGVPKGHAGKFGKGGKTFGAEQFSHNSGDSVRPNADGTRTTIDGLRQQIARINENENKKVLSPTGQSAATHQKEVVDIENVGKSWELFLEKGLKFHDPNTKRIKGSMTKVPIGQPDDVKGIEADAEEALKKPRNVLRSWESWIEKMQGAGDARYGNQHLTGMEQHPVADDESMELSAETEENNEKEEKKEDKGDKDNKPYKALSQE